MRTCDTQTLMGEIKWYAWFIDLIDCFAEYKGVLVLGRYPFGWQVATNFTRKELQGLLYRRLMALFGERDANRIANGWD